MSPVQVYNVTPYIRFHPGGVKYIMMGAGRDATALFNKYHAWVNIDFLLAKCLVGVVEARAELTSAKTAPRSDGAPLQPAGGKASASITAASPSQSIPSSKAPSEPVCHAAAGRDASAAAQGERRTLDAQADAASDASPLPADRLGLENGRTSVQGVQTEAPAGSNTSATTTSSRGGFGRG